MAKKITLKNKAGEVLCPHTAIEQVQGLKEALDDKLGKTEKAASATNANTSKKLCTAAYGGGDLNLNTFTVTDGSVEYRSIIPNTAANMPDPTGYQNSVMSFGLHDNGTTAQMFFAKDKPLYYRSSQTGEWQQIATTDDVDKAFNYLGYNLDLNEFYDNENKSGTVYVNTPDGAGNITNAPEYYGGAVNFGAGVSNFQLFSYAFSNKLYHRSRWWSEKSEWSDWKQIRFIEDLVTTSHIADAAITPAKIQTSIALNGTPSMTVEPTTSSPDRTIASVGLVKKAVENIEIGGTNLILNSDFSEGTEHWSLWYNTGTLSVVDKVATFSLSSTQTQGVLQTSAFNIVSGEEYVVSFDVRSDNLTSLNYCYLMSSSGNISQPITPAITTAWQRIEYKFKATATGNYMFGFGMKQAASKSFQIKRVKIEKGNKATDWSPAPEDINTEISNAEIRSKAHAEDYTNAEIDKIEYGQTVAQKANSLYDADSNKYKNWGEIDTAITRKIGNKFEDYATKSYVQGEISKQVAVPIASETEDGKVKLATPEDVTAVENDISAVNDSAKAVTPYTLKEYIASKNFATSGDISSAVTAAKTTIFFQVAQPAGGKDGDIWIKP